MTHPCSLPAEDLIAYGDGYLTGARRELVEAHLAVCPHCQQRVAAFADVDRVLREGTPFVDDPIGRASVEALLRGKTSRRRLPPQLLAVPLHLRHSAPALAVCLEPATWAGCPLGRSICFHTVT
jgi:anti-sigma factor RsiW